MRIRWLSKALQNLENEAAYIALDDPIAARKIVQRIFEQIDRLEENPALGRPGRIHGTRELLIARTGYIVPYRVRPSLDRVEILRVFHGSRRLPYRW